MILGEGEVAHIGFGPVISSLKETRPRSLDECAARIGESFHSVNQLHNLHSIFAKSCKKCRMEYSASKSRIRFKFNSSPVAKV